MLLRARQRLRERDLFLAGLFLGIAVLMKQHALFLVLFGCCAIFASGLRNHEISVRLVRQSSIYLSGAATPYLCIATFMFISGSFSHFWFWTFRYPREYISYLSVADGLQSFLYMVRSITGSFQIFWIMGLSGIAVLFFCSEKRYACWFTLGLLLFSFISICPGFYFRGHYFILLLPVWSILAALAFGSLSRLIPSLPSTAADMLPAFLLVVAVAFSVWPERYYLFQADSNQVSRMTYGENFPFRESINIADFLRRSTAVEDRIAVLGSEPQIYFYANRRSATGHIYMYGLMEEQPHALTMQKEMIREIEQSRPAYLVLVNLDTSWLLMPRSVTMVLNWARNYTRSGYLLEKVVDMPGAAQIFPANGIPFSESQPDKAIYIFRRKDHILPGERFAS
jgi:hypothetical protein